MSLERPNNYLHNVTPTVLGRSEKTDLSGGLHLEVRRAANNNYNPRDLPLANSRAPAFYRRCPLLGADRRYNQLRLLPLSRR